MPDVQADVVMSEDPSPTTSSTEFSYQARSLPSITDVAPSPALGPFDLNNGQPPHGVDMHDDPSLPSTGDVGPTDSDYTLHTPDVQSTSSESPTTLMKTTKSKVPGTPDTPLSIRSLQRKGLLTPRKLKMQQTLAFVARQRAEMKQNHLNKVKK